MAYSSVRVQFEVGHEASLRNKRTPEGFTHDWEVFVRGADSTDIQCFVDKVVFYLHETFQKPKRVVKEPPYSVKESGYAGFVLLIDVYLKNKEEPKKITFDYDLQLQTSGPPISRVLREPRVFQNPSEDFRRKLILGGGVGVDSPFEVSAEDGKQQTAAAKPKTAESQNVKKHKTELPLSNSFADLFGPPIRRITPEPKKVIETSKKVSDISDVSKDKKKPNKDARENTKEKFVEKEKPRERDKGKEKNAVLPPPISKTADDRKHDMKDKKKDGEEKKKKKDDKEKKEKHKETKYVDKPIDKEYKKDKQEIKESEYNKKNSFSKPQDIPVVAEKQNNNIMEKDREKPEKEKHKHRHKKKEREKNKDKERHKKDKEKGEKDAKEKERLKMGGKRKHEETKEKTEKAKMRSKSPSPSAGGANKGGEGGRKGPLNTLLDELGSSDSLSPLSDDEDSIPSFKVPVKSVPDTKPVTTNIKPKSTNQTSVNEATKEIVKKSEDIKPDRAVTKKSKRDSEKKKPSERSLSKERQKEEEERARKEREDKERLEKEKERMEKLEREKQERERLEAEKVKSLKKEKEESRKRKREKVEENATKVKRESPQQETTSQDDRTEETGVRRPERFSKEYVAQLRDLQHRIMTLEDNAELQKVVQVIAETGQFEVTKKTFDFDLCALDNATVRRLQDFFST